MEDQDKVHCYSLGLNYFRQKQNPDMENKEQMVQVCQIGRSKNEKVEKNALHQVTAKCCKCQGTWHYFEKVELRNRVQWITVNFRV